MVKKHNRKIDIEPINFWNSFFFKFCSRVLIGVFVILVFLTLIQCTVKKPESPSWNTTFVVPVISRTYDMAEIISKINQDEISIDSAGNISFSITEELDTVKLDTSDLATGDLSYLVSDTLGLIRIDAPSVAPVSVSLASISGLITSGLPNDQALVDTFSFSLYNNMPTISNFTQATISNGQMIAFVNNNLGINMDTVIIELYDINNASTIATDSFSGGISSGDTDSLIISLSGVTISNSIRVNTFCYTPGGIITQASTRYLETGIGFVNPLEVSSAMAEVPAIDTISFSEQVALSLDSGERIDSASLSNGTLNISIMNATELAANLTITIPELKLNGTVFNLNSAVPATGTVNINRDLAGYTLSPVNDSVNINVIATSPGSNGVQVQVDQNDSLRVDATLSSLSFSSVTGVFASNSANFNNIQQGLNVPDGFDNIGLVTAVLTLEVENGVDLPGSLNIQLNGNNGKSLNLSGAITARGTAQTTLSTITNNNVADFLSPLPDSIDVSGSIQFGDTTYQGTITSSDFVVARVNIYVPMEVKINNAEITDLDIEKENINQADINIITDHVNEARFVYEIINHLPLGVRALIHLSGDSASLYSTPLVTLDTLSVVPAPVSLITGIASNDTTSSGEIFLDSLDIQVLNNDTLFVRPEIYLNGTDTSGVKLTGNDYITFNGRIEVEYYFNGEF